MKKWTIMKIEQLKKQLNWHNGTIMNNNELTIIKTITIKKQLKYWTKKQLKYVTICI